MKAAVMQWWPMGRARRWRHAARSLANRLHAAERGISSIEFALIIPVFLMLILGTLDLGLMAALYGMTSEAARDGARAAKVLVGQGHAPTLSVSESSVISTAASKVTGPLAAIGVGGELAVTPTMQQDANGYWYVRVTVTTSYQPVAGAFLGIGSTTVGSTSSLAVPCGRC